MVGRLGIGNGIGIPFRNKVSGGGQSLPPELKEALCGVWIADQNTNESPTRNIIKNKIANAGGDFEILNAAYKGNSGYGLYKLDFSRYRSDQNTNGANVTFDFNKVEFTNITVNRVNAYYAGSNYIPAFTLKVKASGLKENGTLSVNIKDTADLTKPYIQVYEASSNGIHTIPVPNSYRIVFTLNNPEGSAVIEQIPEYNGAFITDGVDDLIVSQKNTSEILDFNKDFTVISMITLLKNEDSIYANQTNTVPYNGSMCISSIKRTAIDKTGIFGYYKKDAKVYSINDILGDKDDYLDGAIYIDGYKYPKILVVGAADTTGYIGRNASIAWYWTLIAKRVLTTDEINQVIAYYNLDKYVAPDVYYDVKKQGLTNENHAEFGNKLIDYSGNGRDMQLYNFGWKLDSGVGKYEEDFSLWVQSRGDLDVHPNKFTVINATNPNSNNYLIWRSGNGTVSTSSFIVKVTGLVSSINLNYVSIKNGLVVRTPIYNDGIYNLPASEASGAIGFNVKNGKDPNLIGLTIEQLPSFEGALVFDGVDDYGKVEGLPIYKDYTVIADRALLNPVGNIGVLVSKAYDGGQGAFIMDEINSSWSFGSRNTVTVQTELKNTYQTKYVYNGQSINAGTGIDSTSMWLATIRDNNNRYSKVAIKSLMTFPYSLSEFLIERQLKKRKLGTLYPETNNK